MFRASLLLASAAAVLAHGAGGPGFNSGAHKPEPVKADADRKVFGAYFANWAQYHAAGYSHTAYNVAPIAPKLDRIFYSFLYFCPPAGTSPMPYWGSAPYGNCNSGNEYELLSVEPKDTEYLPTMVGYKNSNPNLKIILSIGGWNFPSEYFSKMVANSASRAKFIASAKQWMQQYNADGIDIDWEFPCSAPRSDPVKITCEMFRTVSDAGGNCPADTNNLVLLAKEMRAAFPDKQISIASQAGAKNADNMALAQVTPYIDYWNMMTYDYTVSDIPDQATMNPNCPLYNPKEPGTTQMSINQTVHHYLAAGVPPSKMMVGIPLYAHTWYAPSATSTWNSFGGKAEIQGECCGPFKNTYGAKFGQGCQQCGTMMYSEILKAKPQTFYDETTQSAIAYLPSQGADGYTEAGTWISYNDEQSMTAIVKYANSMNLAGVFMFDTSMDTPDYQLMNSVANTLGGH